MVLPTGAQEARSAGARRAFRQAVARNDVNDLLAYESASALVAS